MYDTVTLVGLDFGTTTSCAAIASAKLACNSATGRTELKDIEPRYYSEQVFTPFCGDQLDECRLAFFLDQWLKDVDTSKVFGGGALVTGLAAQASNAGAFARQVRRHLKDAIVAVAEDPRLEAWLAFMGNSRELSRANPNRVFINFDIGGGTTNVAIARNGEILRAGSYFVGARHVQLEPGSYRITRLSAYARGLFDHLSIHKQVGERLTEGDVQQIMDWYLSLLESIARGTRDVAVDSLTALHTQVSAEPPSNILDPAITLSGGVGQLVYHGLQTGSWPQTTTYGDLGIDMARRLVQRAFWRDRLSEFVPPGLGRATLFGLLRYNTQVSGNTLYLSDPRMLPLRDLVILGSVSSATPQAEVDRLISLASKTSPGACLRVELEHCDHALIGELAPKLREAIERQSKIHDIPLVLLVRENLGKVLGQLVTNWGVSPAKVVVIDQIDAVEAQFACIGRLHQGVVPVSFHGMNPPGGNS